MGLDNVNFWMGHTCILYLTLSYFWVVGERTHKGREYQKANIGEFAQAFKKKRLRKQLKKRFHGLRTDIKTRKWARNSSMKYKKSLPYGKLAEADYLSLEITKPRYNLPYG